MFKKFLVDDLHVPLRNIVLLEDGAATRAKILSTLQTHLRDNPDTPDHGKATILLYFAGHGSRVDAPEAILAPEGRIEMLCPVDYKMKNAGGKVVQAIPDYVLNRLLGQIAEKKSQNIILILDCCHSGGMDRDVDKTARSVRSDSYIPVDLDRQIWQGKGEAVSYRTKSLSPCVLLAACGADEKAREFTRPDGTVGGRFTSELIPLLRQAPLGCTTATELINQRELRELPNQSPRCAGGRSNRPFLNIDLPATGVLLTPQKRPSRTELSNSLQKFRVEIGSFIGVLPGTEFEAYNPNQEYLCTFVAQSVSDDHSILVGKDAQRVNIPPWSRAVVSDWKGPQLRIHIPEGFQYAADLFPVLASPPQRFVQAGAVEDADIAVKTEGGEIVIGFVKSQRENRITLPGNAVHLPGTVEGVIRFNYFLNCANKTDAIEGMGLEMYRLEGEYPTCKPDPQSVNLIQNGKVRLVSDKGAKVWLHVAHQQWYSPACTRTPLLSDGGTVTLGMGSDRAFQFELSPGELASSGFFKLFVTDEYIDLGWIKQEMSPFEGTGRLRLSHESLDLVSMRWDALTVALTITAPAKNGSN
ncbi:CASPASE-P20 domain-containing protein [Mycena sanguinolenta]|uniref:CASPASE-P20 domain-containing protein n=1 Tax=Mycena sanguinolenta TaxID=230812 RepID=A0A8H6Y5R9_9AGAR|nr:CASPASE-P20 domain-containing protein [Mycena sanguinolenta]